MRPSLRHALFLSQIVRKSEVDKLYPGETVGGNGHEHGYAIDVDGDGQTDKAGNPSHFHRLSSFLVEPLDHSHALDRVFEGFQVEAEHTPDGRMRMEIALDHLKENPDYYSILKKAGL